MPFCPVIKRQGYSFLILVLAGLSSGALWAQEMATVLPPRVHRTRMVNIFSRPVTQKYNGDGKLELLTAPLNQNLDLSTLAAGTSDPAQKAQLEQLRAALNGIESGLGDQLQVNLRTDAKISNYLMYFALERGLSTRLSGGLSVPYLRQDIKAGFRSENNVQGLDIARKSQGIIPDSNLNDFTNNVSTQSFEQKLFTSRGYKVPQDFKVDTLGDIEAGLKYQFIKSSHDLTALTVGVRLPTTSHKTDYTNLLDRGVSGITDNQLDVGAQIVNDFLPTENLVLGSSVQYTVQLPDHQNRPVYKKGEALPPNLNDPGVWDKVRRDVGDLLEAELSATQTFFQKSLSFWALYQWKYKLRDSYSGNRDYLDYARLEGGTDYNLHRYEIGLGYTTVPAYLKNRVFAPFNVRLSYNDIFRAKNSPRSPYTRLDLWAYF